MVRRRRRSLISSRSIATVLACIALPSIAEARGPCKEEGVPVGETKCSRYGDNWTEEGANSWRAGRLVFSGGAWLAQAAASGFSTELDQRTITGYGAQLQARGSLWNQLTLGGSFAMAWGHTRYAPIQEDKVTLSYGGGANTQIQRIGLMLGYRVPLHERISLRPELMGALRSVEIDGALKVDQTTESGSLAKMTAIVQPRLGADVWLTPWLSIDVAFAMSVLDVRDRGLGISLSYHSRAYDGRASF